MTDLPDPWEGVDETGPLTSESNVEPHKDPKSEKGHLVVGVNVLRRLFKGKQNIILRNNLIGSACNSRRFWFRDTPEVRRELGMP